MIHPFSDGNCRTFAILLLNKLLLDNGFSPVIIKEPNRFDGFTVDELVKEIENGEYWFINREDIELTTQDHLKLQARRTKSALHVALSVGLIDNIINLIPLVKNINHIHDGKTPLMLAAIYGYEDVINELLKHPAIDINQADELGCTAAMWASQSGNDTIAKLLTERTSSNNIHDHRDVYAPGLKNYQLGIFTTDTANNAADLTSNEHSHQLKSN